MSDTVTISRGLFERLCEAAEFTKRYHEWLETTCDVYDDDGIWKKTHSEALAIRDREKND